ncbi:hypothetical protein KC726_04395 [Candidatus Woesebacteria bacterium]|nr:hypothetical protein [Candidatus Woesebacteria bacterium]
MKRKGLKLYFTGSIAARDKYLDQYKKIVAYAKDGGKNEVIADHMFKVSEKEINMSTRKERLAFHAKLERWIHSCDGIIAETSFPSISVGYEISLALKVGKPVLILYSEGGPPSLLAHHKDEKLLCEKYSSDTLKRLVSEFLEYIQSSSDLRFTFFITPKISSYLNTVAKKDKLPKSVYLRKLIENDMKERME